MTPEVIIRPEAEAEIADAHDWYEARVPGLGADFFLAVDAILHSIARTPKQYPVVHRNIRRALTKRFPYEVFFLDEDQRIVVLAVFHASRNPKSWTSRI